MKSLIRSVLVVSVFLVGCNDKSVVVMEPVALSPLASSQEHEGRPRYSPRPAPKVVAKPKAVQPKHTHSHPPAKKKKRASRSQRVTPPLTGGGVWDRLAACEAGGNWSINTGNGYYGGLQFSLSSWRAVGGSGLPSNASKSEQIRRGEMLRARQGWGAWPACSRKLGLR